VALTDKYERRENFEYREKLDWPKFWGMWRTRSNQVVFVQAFFGCGASAATNLPILRLLKYTPELPAAWGRLHPARAACAPWRKSDS
jgi:hypothetical protein